MSDDVDRMVRMFGAFARHEFAGHSARYELLSHAIADAPGLGEPLLSAPPAQRRAILYFAATQYLLRGPARGHPLAGYLPTLGGHREPDGGLVPAFAAFVRDDGGDLAAVCASRTTQTNEARRAALLRPAFAHAAGLLDDRPVALVELGTSAGLLLVPDRYAYRYGEARFGRPDAPAELTMSCEPRGCLPPDLDRSPAIQARIGLDVHPVDAADPAATDWLRSCIWPEQVDRLARLEAALAEVAAVRPRLVAGDMVAGLDGRPTVTALGDTAPHGQWLDWHPVGYPYRPPALAAALAAQD